MARFSTELQNFFLPLSEGSLQKLDNSGPLTTTSANASPANALDEDCLDTKENVANARDAATSNIGSVDTPQLGDVITIMDLLELAGERTFGVLLVLLALPSALPIPAPGYSTPFGVIIVLLALQMVIGCHRPWFPKSVRNRSIKREQAQGLLKAGLPWLQRLEQISRPRFSFMSNSVLGRSIIGLMIALMGLCMMIPIPGTNTIPAMIIFILGFSLIEEDGLVSLFGVTAGCAGSAVVAIALQKGLPLLLETIQSF